MQRPNQTQLLKQLKPLVISDQWKVLMDYIDISIEQDLDALIGANTWELSKELQGRIKHARFIKSIPDKIRALERGK